MKFRLISRPSTSSSSLSSSSSSSSSTSALSSALSSFIQTLIIHQQYALMIFIMLMNSSSVLSLSSSQRMFSEHDIDDTPSAACIDHNGVPRRNGDEWLNQKRNIYETCQLLNEMRGFVITDVACDSPIGRIEPNQSLKQENTNWQSKDESIVKRCVGDPYNKRPSSIETLYCLSPDGKKIQKGTVAINGSNVYRCVRSSGTGAYREYLQSDTNSMNIACRIEISPADQAIFQQNREIVAKNRRLISRKTSESSFREYLRLVNKAGLSKASRELPKNKYYQMLDELAETLTSQKVCYKVSCQGCNGSQGNVQVFDRACRSKRCALLFYNLQSQSQSKSLLRDKLFRRKRLRAT